MCEKEDKVEHLHNHFWGGPGKVVAVTLSSRANVMLLDDANYSAYRRGRSFRYVGGFATASPVRLGPPRYGHWHVVVDLGGSAGTVRAGISIVDTEPAAV